MARPAPSDARAAAMQILGTLDEVLDRYMGRSDAERQEALLTVVRQEMGNLSPAERSATLTALRALLPIDGELPALTPGVSAGPRVTELEEELAHLRERLRSLTTPAPNAVAVSPDLAARLARALHVPGRDLGAVVGTAGDVETRLVDVLGLLIDFALGLLRAYIPVTEDEDRTVAGLVQQLVTDAVLGRGDAGALAKHVERTERQIGGQVLAFRRACEEGARSVLKALQPIVLEAEVARGATFLERKFGTATQCWELYQKRFEEVRTATDVYQAHFDGPLRVEMHRLAKGQGPKRTS